MRVAFFHVRQEPRYADIAVFHVKRHMPGVEVLHITDEQTPALAGCTPFRMPWDGRRLMEFRVLLLSQLDGELLSLGTDVVVQRDLSKVFDWPFDAALTQRTTPVYDATGYDVTRAMPFNSDVSFTRGRQFWTAVHKRTQALMDKLGDEENGIWYAEQVAMAQVAPQFDVLRLACENFNHTPKTEDEDVSRRFAVHYKGNRKPWMLARAP